MYRTPEIAVFLETFFFAIVKRTPPAHRLHNSQNERKSFLGMTRMISKRTVWKTNVIRLEQTLE
jgi:hypothetical protein